MIDWILENTLVVSVLALGLSAVARWMKQRPALLHVLWLVLLARLVTPPIPTLSELPRELPGHGLAAAAERTGRALFSLVPDAGAAPAAEGPAEGTGVEPRAEADRPALARGSTRRATCPPPRRSKRARRRARRADADGRRCWRCGCWAPD